MTICTRFFVFIFTLIISLFIGFRVNAAEPVRLAITADSNSGIEQEIVDHISARLGDNPNVVISTVNPDWFVRCKISDNQDRMGGQIRYNGTVAVKTPDGQMVSTVSVQKYNQDYSVEQGAPLNKKLVDSAAREVIDAASQRATDKIQEAVEIEIKTRSQISTAEKLSKDDKYDDAIVVLKEVGRDSVHFQAVQKTIATYEIEKRALELVRTAEVKAKQGQYNSAIALLKDVDTHSKRYKLSKQLTVKYRNLLAAAQARARAKNLAKTNTNGKDNKSTLH